MIRWMTTTLAVVAIAWGTGRVEAAEAPRILELRTQKADGITYFHLRLDRPSDLQMPAFDTSKPVSESDRRKFARLPRLVSQDGKTRTVYYRHKPTQPGLSFCGQVTGGGKAGFVLLYPTRETVSDFPLPLARLVNS